MDKKNITTTEGPVNQAPASTEASTTRTAKASEQTTPATTEAQPTTAQTTPANPSTEATKTQTGEQTAPNIQTPAPGNSVDATLCEYLANGYYKGEGKGRYIDPALVGHAETIGTELAAGGVTRAAFNRMVKTLKSAAKLPYEAQQGALRKLMPQVLKEEGKKKAPALLREIVERNMGKVKCEADFAACLDHFRDIAVYLSAAAKAS